MGTIGISELLLVAVVGIVPLGAAFVVGFFVGKRVGEQRRM